MSGEGLRVRNDPRNSQMKDWIKAIRAAWWAFWDIREASLAERRGRIQQERIRRLSDEELLQLAAQWGSSVVWPELRRRGLPLPGGWPGA